MTTLTTFISEIKTGALARNSHYYMNFTAPAIFANSKLNSSNNMQRLFLYCNSAQLPGINISTFQSRTFGETREMPYERLFDNVSLSFYVDRNMHIKKFFDQWIDGIQDPITRNFNYYENYTTDISIIVKDVADKPAYIVTLYEAYPKTMSPITLGYDQKDVMQLQVSMNYKYWDSVMVSSVEVSNRDDAGQIQALIDPFESLTREIDIPFSMDTFMNPNELISQQLVDMQGLGDYTNINLGSVKNFFA